MRKTIVSLFDLTGNMVRPLANLGHVCYCFDIQTVGMRYEECANGGGIIFMHADLFNEQTVAGIVHLKPAIVFSFTPCTDLAVSGAKHFQTKLAKNPRVFDEAMALFRVAETVANAVGCPYMIENPVSRAATLWRKPDHKFHPWMFGGYLPADDVHPRWPQYIVGRDAYPKLTCLWTGNGFTMPEARPVAVDPGYSLQFKKLGGKSLRTKNIRSETPRGFAEAMAQHLHQKWSNEALKAA